MATLAIPCPHCPIMESKGIFHTKNCKCGHHHAKHNYGGGCTICKDCNQYDQTSEYRKPVYREPIKLKPVKFVEFAMHEIHVDELFGQTKETLGFARELVAAQKRIDESRKKKEQIQAGSSTAEPRIDNSVDESSSLSPPTKE